MQVPFFIVVERVELRRCLYYRRSFMCDEKCKPAMVIGVSFSVCVGVVVGETFFGDATTGINGGSFTYCAHTG
ncbi:hypothetical protein DEO72_LG5g1482 [Vigna unguiculata]|uniref:Uncharacterized protein n=1 Tax=Vigna unguiculata TaxID=3917 RepID=A0A4D6LXJ2_VIGUN|nr:hypothetical protein DEO72_LG5g1482 [Vigna unguiculata]